ncbi:type 4a pilus biogenesis protein PilO [bacterium]|nr:type 4a pilus biogenesis protein PilO [bacterium]
MSFLKKRTSREKYLILLTVTVLVSVGLYLYVLEPLWVYWHGMDSTIYNLEKKLQRSQIILSREQNIEAEYLSYEKRFKLEGSDQEKTAVILKEIETAARSNKVHINDIKPRQIKDEEFYKYYVIELEVEANVIDLSKFIYDLQISTHALRVTRIQIGANSSSPNQLKTEMLVTKVLLY